MVNPRDFRLIPSSALFHCKRGRERGPPQEFAWERDSTGATYFSGALVNLGWPNSNSSGTISVPLRRISSRNPLVRSRSNAWIIHLTEWLQLLGSVAVSTVRAIHELPPHHVVPMAWYGFSENGHGAAVTLYEHPPLV